MEMSKEKKKADEEKEEVENEEERRKFMEMSEEIKILREEKKKADEEKEELETDNGMFCDAYEKLEEKCAKLEDINRELTVERDHLKNEEIKRAKAKEQRIEKMKKTRQINKTYEEMPLLVPKPKRLRSGRLSIMPSKYSM